ncbi:unnamed protein product [Musa hybrid cultivar]
MATWSSTWRPRQLDLNPCRSPGSSLNLTKKKERELSTHGMLARKEEVGSKKAQVARDASTTITTATGHVMAVSEFIAQFDEAARKRLNRMNEKLKELETQMEALEAEMSKADDSSDWS